MKQTGSKTGRKPASDKGQAVKTSKDNSTALSEDELKQVSGGTGTSPQNCPPGYVLTSGLSVLPNR